MGTISKQFKQILITTIFISCVVPAISQLARPRAVNTRFTSSRLKEFYRLAAEANVAFVFPKGFKEIKAPDDEYFSFDYAIGIAGKDFEIWFQVKSQKQNWESYQHTQNSQNARQANPDSLYNDIGTAHAITFMGNKQYFVRTIPPQILAQYNADAGKTYLLTLLDLPETKHYKYALLITLQKNHTGTILAVCFTNVKGPEFFKNIERARNCIKFKTGA